MRKLLCKLRLHKYVDEPVYRITGYYMQPICKHCGKWK